MDETTAKEARYNFFAAAVVGSVVGVVTILLAGRFVMTMLGASSESALVSAIYTVTAPLVAPLYGILGNSARSGTYFEIAALAAIGFYALIAIVLMVCVRTMTAPVVAMPWRPR
jgi:ATP/ADP translocase